MLLKYGKRARHASLEALPEDEEAMEQQPEEAPEIDFEALVHRHQADVWRFLRVLGCDASLADDLTQEAFLALLDGRFEERNDAETLSFLRTAAKHRLISLLRKEKRKVEEAYLDTIETDWRRFAGEADTAEQIDALRECLRKLDERERYVLQLRYRDKLPREDIAIAVNLSEGGVKNLMERAKRQLKDCVERTLKR